MLVHDIILRSVRKKENNMNTSLKPKTTKPVMPEDQYRRKLRMTARLLDYDVELKNIGYGEEYLVEVKKNPLVAMHGDARLSHMLNSFTKKATGYEQELLVLFDKYDNLLKNCKTEQERRAMGSMGVVAISKLLDDGEVGLGGGALLVNGQVITDNKKVVN